MTKVVDPRLSGVITSNVGVCAGAALLGFAANSLLTRMALGRSDIDPATFTVVRIGSGALTLAMLVRLRSVARPASAGAWPSAVALFIYAAAFSYAYLRIGAGVGALILFGCVQITMIGWGVLSGERPRPVEWVGLMLALGGLVVLTAPGRSAPDLTGSLLMAIAGMAWAAYSLRGRALADPLGVTARNFAYAVVFALVLSALTRTAATASLRGVVLAVASGSLASGVGYALWYRALPALTAFQAAVAQLLVPVMAAAGAILWLGESLSPRLLIAGANILSGVAIVIAGRNRQQTHHPR